LDMRTPKAERDKGHRDVMRGRAKEIT